MSCLMIGYYYWSLDLFKSLFVESLLCMQTLKLKEQFKYILKRLVSLSRGTRTWWYFALWPCMHLYEHTWVYQCSNSFIVLLNLQESLNWRASVKFNLICLLSKLSFILVFWGREFIAHVMFLRTVFQQKWVLVGFLTTPITAKIKLLSQQVHPRLWDLLVMLTEAYPGGSFSFMGSSIKYCGGYVKAKYLDLRRCKQPGSNKMVGTYQQHKSCICILLGYYWMSLSKSLYIMAPL